MMRVRPMNSELRARLWLVLAAFLLWVPLGGLPIWRHVYGFVGDLTPATWALLFVWLGFPGLFRF